jgi:hypothetical protein
LAQRIPKERPIKEIPHANTSLVVLGFGKYTNADMPKHKNKGDATILHQANISRRV